ncbi:MAG: hypothetical protein PHV57_04050 [Methanomicrobiaceae archaeon]|nr:hypothetical protein [Methanomicrobiaceae archaeon]
MAAEHAEREGRRTVTRQDVMQVSRTVIAPTLQAKAAGLTEGESLLLCRIAEQAAFGSGEMTAGAVFAAVGERMRIGYTTYHTRLKQLAAAGIIDLPVRTGRGRTREIVLRYDPLQVLSVCGER